MRTIVIQSLRFLFFVFAQVLIFNQIEIGWGIQPMIYPLFILLLPFETSIIPMMLLAFGMGISIDAMSNTYGLHTSSLVLFAYLRPVIFKVFSPRDGYDTLKESNVFQMGHRWFLYVFGTLLLIHHFWFFMIEIFKFNEMAYVIQKLILSSILSYIFCILFQLIFIKRTKSQ